MTMISQQRCDYCQRPLDVCRADPCDAAAPQGIKLGATVVGGRLCSSAGCSNLAKGEEAQCAECMKLEAELNALESRLRGKIQ